MASKFVDPSAVQSSPQQAQPPQTRFNDPSVAQQMPQQMGVPQQQQGSTWTAPNVARQALGQGLALGFGDEIEGLIRGVYEGATSGKSFEDAVNESIDYVRAQNTEFESQNPKSALALQVGGGMLTGFAGGGRALAAKGLSMGAKVGRGALTGAGVGGTTGAGMAEGGASDRALPAAIGATIGGVTGGTLPVAMAGASKVLSPIIGRMLPGGSRRQAEGLFRNTAAEDSLTAGKLSSGLDDIGPQGVPADVGGPSMKDLARYSGNKFGGKSAQEMLDSRHVDQGVRIAESINKNISDVPLDDYIDGVGKLRRASANKNYGKLYESEMPLTDELKGYFKNKVIQKAYEEAGDIAEAQGDVLTPLFQEVDGATVYLKPNMKTLDYIKQSLDDKVEEAFRSGKNKLGGALKSLRDDFRDDLDKLAPDYKAARSEYAGHSAALESSELGAKFISSPKSVSVKKITEMGDHEHEAFLVGVADELRYKVLSAPDAADVTKRIFGNHNVRARLKAAFRGDEEAYNAFEKTIKNEAAMAETNASVRFGSRTAPMISDNESFGKAAGFVGDSLGAAAGNPVAGIGMAGRMVDALSAPPEAVAKHLTGLVLSQDPAKQKMAIELLRRGPTVGNRAGAITRALATPAIAYEGAN
mgnify:FL=1